MSLSTYGGLKDSIAAWATRSDLTDTIPDFVTWAHEEICRRLRANVLLASASLTLNAEVIAQPTRFLAFKSLYLDTTPRRRIHTTSADGAMELSSAMSSDTYPTHVAVEGTNLRFAPLFTGTTTVAKAMYYQAPVALAADVDTNTVLALYPYLYLYGSLEALFSYLEDDNNSDRYGQKFGALIEDINSRDAMDVMSGPLQSTPYAGGVI